MMRRTVVAMLVALAVVAGGPAGTAGAQTPPVEPVPTTPSDVTARPADGRAHVLWTMPGTPPVGGGGPSYRFTVTPYIGRVAQPATVTSGRCCSGSVLVTGLANATAYRFTVTAANDTGSSAPSARSAAVRPQPWGPYATPERLSRRMHRMFAFRRSTPAEDAAWREALEGGTRASALILDLIETGEWDRTVGAVIRYYALALTRPVDSGGLRYWHDELRTGRRTLSEVARAIGGSAEFHDRNGGPAGEWVRNTFRAATNRWPSPTDQAYWEGQLARGVPRWKVALLFSQSAEHRPWSRNPTDYFSLKAGFHDDIPSWIYTWQDLWYLGEGTLTIETLVDEHLLGAGEWRGPPI